MFMFSLLCALVALAVYLCTARMRMVSRILLALSVFILGVGGMIGMLVYVGDQPEGCSQTIYENFEAGPIENCD
jgi:hypothetical protein